MQRERKEELVEQVRLFPEAFDVLTRQEMRDAKGNWRSLIDQQTQALTKLRAAIEAADFIEQSLTSIPPTELRKALEQIRDLDPMLPPKGKPSDPGYGLRAAKQIAAAALSASPSEVSEDELVERVAKAIGDALPESDTLSLAPSQIKRAARAAIAALRQAKGSGE